LKKEGFKADRAASGFAKGEKKKKARVGSIKRKDSQDERLPTDDDKRERDGSKAEA